MTIQESLDRLVDILKSANVDDLKENYPHIAEALEIDADSVDSSDADQMIESIRSAVENVDEDDVAAVVEEINNFFIDEDTEEEDEDSLDEAKDKDDDEEEDEEDDDEEMDEAGKYKKKKKKKMNEAASLSGVMSKVGKGEKLSDDEEKMLSAAIDAVKGEARKKVDAIMKKVRSGKELSSSEEKQLGAAIDAEKNAKNESFYISASDLDVSEDVNAIFSGEELTEEFQEKAKTIFETAVVNKVNEKVSQIVEEFDDLVEEKTQEIEESYAEKIDEYLDYVISEWTEENKIALQSGIRTDMMESFVDAMRDVFSEHYMELPEDKVDLVNELQDKVEELETGLNEALDQNAKLNRELKESHKEDAIDEVTEGLTEYQKEKLRGLLENVEVDEDDEDFEGFKSKANTIKESYFPSEKEVLNEDNVDDEPVDDDLDDNSPVGRYAKALNRFGR